MIKVAHQHIIEATTTFVKQELEHAEGGHDWFHTQRVFNNAILIAGDEDVDMLIVQLAALLHDIADSKFHGGDETVGPKKAGAFLATQEISEEDRNHIIQIIANVSFKGGNGNQVFHSKELAVVQDADRLDALGAVGIARTFNYGGFKNRKLYDPDIPAKLHMTPAEYKASTAPTINHFYEKLLLLKDTMHTKTAKKIAQDRHQFMETFLEQFYNEWNGKQ